MKKFWKAIYYLIATHLPKTTSFGGKNASKFRAFCAKRFCTKIGKNVNIDKNVFITNSLQIGNNSGLGRESIIGDGVSIGENVMMGPECYIYTRNHRHNDLSIPMIEQGYEETKSVAIGNNVWIGSRVTILPGVSIGNGVVIGAGAVVTKNMPDNCICGGNPAKVIKFRE